MEVGQSFRVFGERFLLKGGARRGNDQVFFFFLSRSAAANSRSCPPVAGRREQMPLVGLPDARCQRRRVLFVVAIVVFVPTVLFECRPIRGLLSHLCYFDIEKKKEKNKELIKCKCTKESWRRWAGLGQVAVGVLLPVHTLQVLLLDQDVDTFLDDGDSGLEAGRQLVQDFG